MDELRADKSVKNGQNLPISNPKADLHNINAHIKFGENPLIFTKLSPRNENTDVSRADNSVKNWGNLPINNPKPDLHNINAHTEFSDNPLTFTSYHPETKIRTDRRMDTWTANVIP